VCYTVYIIIKQEKTMIKEFVLVTLVFLPQGGIDKQETGFESMGACQVVEKALQTPGTEMFHKGQKVGFSASCRAAKVPGVVASVSTMPEAQNLDKPYQKHCITNKALKDSICPVGAKIHYIGGAK
jgi:hypothetical protein